MANSLLDPAAREHHWISRTIKVVEKRLGRSTGWNGTIELESGHQLDAIRDGAMVVRDDTVLAALRAVANSAAPTTEQADLAAEAISVVAREAARAAAETAPGASQDDVELVAGVAEMWGHQMRAELVSDIGLTDAVPELASRHTTTFRHTYMAAGAARGLLDGLHGRAKQPAVEIAARILTAPADARWNAIADVALDLRVTGEARAAACAAAGAAGRARFTDLLTILGTGADDQRKLDEGLTLGDEVAEQLVGQTDTLTPNSDEYRWAVRVIRAVEQRSGLPLRWNGRIYPEPKPTTFGTVHADDTMTLSDANVLAPVRTAYAHPNALTEHEIAAALYSVQVIEHETAHASGPHPVDDPLDIALEEGLAEVWSYRNRSTIVQDIGMDQDVPATAAHAAATTICYVGYGNAAFGLVDDLARLTGRTSDDVTLRLLGTAPADRWAMIADLAIERQLPMLGAEEHALLKADLVAGLREDYEPVVRLQQDAEPSKARQDLQRIGDEAHRAGTSAVRGLAERIGEVAAASVVDGSLTQDLRQARSIAFDGNVRRGPAAGPSTPAAGTRAGTAATGRLSIARSHRADPPLRG